MQTVFISILFFLTSCSSSLIKDPVRAWESTQGIKTPESTLYVKELDLIFISNINGGGNSKDSKGHISKYSKNGEVLQEEWITGLNAPKGMGYSKGYLWVSDIDQVVAINTKTNRIEKTIDIKGAQFLNDVAIDHQGIIYISDTIGSKIYKIENDAASIFMEGERLESPNGLWFEKGTLYVAAWGLTTDWSTEVPGRLYKINTNTKKITYISKEPLGHLDGLERETHKSFLVSDWSAGKIYRIQENGKTELVFQGSKGLADIGYIKASKAIIVPYMNDNIIFSLK